MSSHRQTAAITHFILGAGARNRVRELWIVRDYCAAAETQWAYRQLNGEWRACFFHIFLYFHGRNDEPSEWQ